MVNKKLYNLFFLFILLVTVFFIWQRYNKQILFGLNHIEKQIVPCRRPVTYTIGVIDKSFKLSEAEFLADAYEAEKIWEESYGQDLFSYDKEGDVKINLIFDNRQQVTNERRAIDKLISERKLEYDNQKDKYDNLLLSYNSAKADLDSMIVNFEKDQKKYEEEVKSINLAGGAEQEVADRLYSEQARLEKIADNINFLVSNLNNQAKEVRVYAGFVNDSIAKMNAEINRYNKLGGSLGRQYEEGLYYSGPEGQKIDLYEFDTKQKLVRLLAHEFGHSLGLEHVSDPESIMYPINQSKNMELTDEDKKALSELCKFDKK